LEIIILDYLSIMKALQYHSPDQPIICREVDEPALQEGEIILELAYSGLNHREVWMTKGLYPKLQPGITLGSDGVGYWNQQAYLINPNVGWGPDQQYPLDTYNILGMPRPGTFAERIAIRPERLAAVPDHLTLSQAAALPLAGLTAYRALIKRAKVTAADRVCISGIGGGVALMILQFALAVGAEVWVTSGREDKIRRAVNMGAVGGQLYTETDWHKKLSATSGGFDLILDSAGGPGFGQLLTTARKGARLIIYGGHRGLIQNLSPQIIFWRHLDIYGSTMGSDEDFLEMIGFVEKHRIVPVIDSVFDLTDFQKAFDRMDRGDQFGKIVFDNTR
jgi:zinc-binding alcohol dehydrogenase/oxidoreductase